MVRPILEYGSPVWDPHCNGLNDELENVQKLAVRFVTRNYSYETGSMTGILEELKWETLQKRRKDNRLVLLYKGTTKIRNGHFLAKWGEMDMLLAKWGQNGQFLGEMGMFHIAIAYNPHANTSFTVLGSVFRINKIKINLKKVKKESNLVS